MRNFLKSLRSLAIILIATAAGAQTATFDPYKSGLPKMIINWNPIAMCGITADTASDLGAAGDEKGKYIASDDDAKKLCDTWSQAKKSSDICSDLGGASSKADDMQNEIRDDCFATYKIYKAKMKNECDYIVAYRTRLNPDGCDYIDSSCGSGSSKAKCFIDKIYFTDGTAKTTPAPYVMGGHISGCSGAAGYCGCVGSIYGVMFQLNTEAHNGCHVHQADQKCESCFEDRADNSDDGHNYKRDQINNADKDDAKKQGGYIMSQGCLPESSNTKIGDVGSGSSLDISKIYSSVSVSPISLLVPKCMVNPIPPTYPYVKFETDGSQKADVYDVIDKTYDDIIKSKKNPYKGNCGRGKFFYSTLPPKDSNLTSQVAPDSTAKITTNDIWESKTGCYNPEERFVILPPGQAKGDSDGKENITFNEPNREIANPNTMGPAGLTGLSGDALVAYTTEAGKALLPITDFSSAWDEVASKDSNGNAVIDTTTTSTYLIPNDRILMRHPMCVKDYNGTLKDEFGNTVSPGTRRARALKNATKQEDMDRIYKFGSLPVCLADDFLDEREGYCAHYFQRMNNILDISGIGSLPLNAANNYTNQRYVFDTASFCWKKDSTTSEAPFNTPLYTNHWMPPAIRGDMTAATTTATDIYGNSHTIHKTDYKRPTFTTYSSRVVKDKYKDLNPLEHEFQSLEEYGYRDQVVPRTDYAFNPENIYAPDSGKKISTEDLLKAETLGRKYEMQQCIGLYLEQWAFEGDKGSIVLDSEAQLLTETMGRVTTDASMCQWVAYYDTSENYGAEDWLKQRNLFKLTMLNYFQTVQKANDDNGNDLRIASLNLSNPLHSQFASTNLSDPNRLQSSSGNGIGIKGVDNTKFVSGLADGFYPDNMNTSSAGFRRRAGMRPEIFDYYNFLSFGSIGTYPEGYDVTNGTKVGDGNPYGETLEDLSGLSGHLPSGAMTDGLQNDLYSVTVNNITAPAANSIGWQVNMERRDCRSVVPPQFWRDVIKPFQGCDFMQGSRMINDINFSLDKRNGAIGHLASEALGTIIADALKALDGSKHWMTTDVNTPILSLMTPVLGLPVLAYGLDENEGVYKKSNTEKFEVQADGSSTVSSIYLEDTWLSRAGGKAVMKNHTVEKPWKLNNWAGLEDPAGQPTDDDKDKKISTDDTNHPGYAGYDIGDSPWYGYDSYKEDPKVVNDQQMLGMVIMDEVTHTSGREWVDHIWPSRTCMHTEPFSITLPTDVTALSSLASSVTSGTSLDSLITTISGFIDVNQITKSALTDDAGDARPVTTSPDGTRKYYSVPVNAAANLGMITDAWGGTDDIFVGTVPVFVAATGSITTPDFDNKQMGGFTVFNTTGKFFEWMPSSWTVSVGINKAFWCEFETPYNPYFTGDEEFMVDKTPIVSNWVINAQKLMVSSETLKSENAKPKLEYYRVERIRDACGPFGVRSTWLDDPNSKLGEWLVGSKFGDETGDPTKHMGKSRCAGWLDLYKKGVTDPKIIAWRLPRFDYEFLKAFLDCTGPVRAVGPNPCEFNKAQFDLNQKAALCESAKAIINAYITLPTSAYGLGEGDEEGKSIECEMNGGSGMSSDTIKSVLGSSADSLTSGCLARGCYKNADDGDNDDNKWTPQDKIADNLIRALDLATRGDTYYGLNMPYKNKAGDVVNDDKIFYALDGFREIEGQHKHSTQIEKFWLKKDDNTFYGENEPFGFWCNCPQDDQQTTRCREDFCTVEQHVLLVGRDLGHAGKSIIPKSISDAVTPVAIAKAPGPFGRWLQCFYQARAKACPVLTREVSDTTAYSTMTDPFQVDSKLQQGFEFTSKGQNFNVCGYTTPTGLDSKQMSQFMRWSREEPNNLARLPVWFESSGDGYRHQDLMFYTQVRDFESPYMEMAVPFPIDLITRSPEPVSSSGNCTYGHEYGTTAIKTGLEMITSGSITQSNPCDKRRINALGEINQREGTYKIDYLNPAVAAVNPTPSTDAAVIHNEINLITTYGEGFRSKLLAKQNTAQIEPTVDASTKKYTDSTKYTGLYNRYLKGLYATSVSFSHQEKPIEPNAPGSTVSADTSNSDHSKNSAISPRAEETIVGPRGCDIGGWYEMMLYQARCIKWFRLNCMCDYDKTFARGNSVNYALKRAGRKLKVAYPDYIAPAYKIEISDKISPANNQARSNSGEGLPQVGSATKARNEVRPKIDFDVYGHAQVTKSNGIRARYDRISFPLADRGILGPEFSPLTTESGFKIQCDKDNPGSGKTKDGNPCGLSQVMVGDIIFWDESISYKLSSGAFMDAGYPRHAAYVETVERSAPDKNLDGSIKTASTVTSVTVKEMDWGKNLDSCGDTDMWGRETSRIIKKPGDDVTSSVSNPAIETVPTPSITTLGGSALPLIPTPATSANPIKGPTNSLASCQNADWAVCVEKFWDQVSIYRPYKVVLDSDKLLDSTTADPAYTSDSCSPTATNYPKILNEARIIEIAEAEGIPLAAAGSEPTEGQVARDSDAISKYVFDQNSPIDPSTGALLPSVSGYSKEEIMYKSQKWKLLVDPTQAAYPIDEVQKFMSNPLSGALDRCDPPVESRENFTSVVRDAENLAGLTP